MVDATKLPNSSYASSTDEAQILVRKRKSRNHLIEQVESFRIGDKGKKLENDLLDAFFYGIAIGLGNNEGF